MKIKPVPPVEGKAVISDIPALILSGELDPYVPTPWATSMLQDLSHAFVVEMRAMAHGPGFSACGQQVIEKFINDPTHAPGDDCIGRLPAVEFTR
jgi:fermentation-respiration switch protein FrsA (DUF1100 family)